MLVRDFWPVDDSCMSGRSNYSLAWRQVNKLNNFLGFSKSHNYTDGAQIAELCGPEMKQLFEDIRERRCLKTAMCHSKE